MFIPFFIVLVLTILAWIAPKKLQTIIEEEYAANPRVLPSDLKSPPALYTFNFVGAKLFGKFRYKQINAELTYVSYYMFCIVIPLIPIKCYRVVDDGSSTFRFWGGDTMKWKELLCIYLSSFKWVLTVITVILLLEFIQL